MLCIYILRQILEGIAFLHSMNKAHLDIKLENIVFDQNFVVKIIDFAFMHSTGPDLGLSICLGT